MCLKTSLLEDVMEDTIKDVMKGILSKVSNIKDDNIHLLIFNKLTHNDTIKNFTNNNNGIYFNLSKMDVDVILDLDKSIDKFINMAKENISIDEQRQEYIDLLKQTIPEELPKKYTSTYQGETFSSYISDDDMDIDTENVYDVNMDEAECSDRELFGDCDSEF